MTDYVKDMRTEFRLFELYGLREVVDAAKNSTDIPQVAVPSDANVA